MLSLMLLSKGIANFPQAEQPQLCTSLVTSQCLVISSNRTCPKSGGLQEDMVRLAAF